MSRDSFLSVLGAGVSAKAAVTPLSFADGGWWGVLKESFAGAFQSAVTVDRPADLLADPPLFSCVTLIASDIAKLCMGLVEMDADGIGKPVPATSPFWQVLRKPNHFQNRIKFIEHWVLSKLLWGNTYILKERDARGIVVALYILDPQRVKPLVTPRGDVYYQLSADNLAGVQGTITIAAKEIIHDRMNCLWHPLVGISPLYAAGMSSTLGSRIRRNSAAFFANMSRPGGMLTAPATIEDDTALRLKNEFENNFGGDKIGRLFVGGDGLEFKPMSVAAEAAQLVEQMSMTAADVARAFHMPLFKIQADTSAVRSSLSVEAQQQLYLNDCLHIHIVDIEMCLTQGLEIVSNGYEVAIDEDDMLRMDKSALFTALGEGVKAGVLSPDEARAKVGLGKVDGGGTPYLQQQNYSLGALAKRDALADPFATAPAPAPAPVADPAVDDAKELAAALIRRCTVETLTA